MKTFLWFKGLIKKGLLVLKSRRLWCIVHRNAVLCVTAPTKPKIGVFYAANYYAFPKEKNVQHQEECYKHQGDVRNSWEPGICLCLCVKGWLWMASISPFVCIFMRGLILTSSNLPFIVEIFFFRIETSMHLLFLWRSWAVLPWTARCYLMYLLWLLLIFLYEFPAFCNSNFSFLLPTQETFLLINTVN